MDKLIQKMSILNLNKLLILLELKSTNHSNFFHNTILLYDKEIRRNK